MFFKLHNENKIGYKALTDADLGRRPTTHQTHIGLFDDVLTFLPNDIEIDDAMVIFNDTVEFLTVNFNRIETPNHDFRSPKIKTGGQNSVSVVSFIRTQAREMSGNVEWFLFWFGLESEQPVFFLFNKESETYNEIASLGIDLHSGVKSRLEPSNVAYSEVVKYLEKIVNESGKLVAEELENALQNNESNPVYHYTDFSHKKTTYSYRSFDIEKARKIGRDGEEIINQYFSEQLDKKYITHYKWVNEEGESGLPYDFHVEELDGTVCYLDVKSTISGFAQKMIFSSQEIKFVDECENKYCIYRVYNSEDKTCLKICDNAKTLFSPISDKTKLYENSLCSMAKVETMKMAIQPMQPSLIFGEEISLSKI